MTFCECSFAPRISPGCLCHSGSDAVTALTTIRRALSGTYTAVGARIWLHAANRRLGGKSPMSLVMAGHGQDAVDEARAVGGGMRG